MNSTRRWQLLGAMFSITLLLLWLAPESDNGDLVGLPASKSKLGLPVVTPGDNATVDDFLLHPRAASGAEVADLFPPAVEKKQKQAANTSDVEKPTAPPLPFTFVGKMVEDNQQKVFLQQAGTVITATEGSMLGTNYKIVSIDNAGVHVVYLPLNVSQTIPIGN